MSPDHSEDHAPDDAGLLWIENNLALIRSLAYMMAAAGAIMWVVNELAAARVRIGGPGLLLLGLTSLLLLRIRRFRAAVMWTCWGLLALAFSSALHSSGLYAISWVAIPVSMIIGGWLLDRTRLVALALASILGIVGILFLHRRGVLPSVNPEPVVVVIVVIIATIISARVGIIAAGSVRRHIREIAQARARLTVAVNDLTRSEQRFRHLFEDTRQATTLMEAGRIVAANRAALDLFGLSDTTPLLGRTPADLSPPTQPDGSDSETSARENLKIALEKGSHRVEWELLRANGDKMLVEALLTVIPQDDTPVLHAVFADITLRKRDAERIHFLAYYDPLTGLPNRTFARESLQKALDEAESQGNELMVLHLDIDAFKHVNEAYGHAIADRLLRAIALRLRGSLAETDLLCRLSGDEFLIVSAGCLAREQIGERVIRLMCELREPFDIEGSELLISASIGIALRSDRKDPDAPQDADILMRHAATALQDARQSGANSYRFFEPQMSERLLAFVRIRDALRVAITTGAFELHYQPKIDLRTGAVSGVEALLRWRRSDGQLASPVEFITVAEESGLIAPIGAWVLDEACRQAAAWRQAGFERLAVAVNLSVVQFQRAQLESDVFRALEASGLDPRLLELELTESLLLQHDESVTRTLAGFKARGIQISIDDFGTGYSNLAYLRQFHLDKIKIDRSFTGTIRDDEGGCAIVRGMIQIADTLGIRVIAEGVEDQELAAQLTGMGCDEAQGYLYARPLPAAALEQWLRQRTAIAH